MPVEKQAGMPADPAGADADGAPSGTSVPAISLPKGGGAIRGIGEKFAANPVTGTASLTVPIASSPGRSGFGPQLALSYDSGAGNGPFGFGWHLAVSSITRKTDKGLPRYRDAEDSDTFVLSDAEDLVPALEANGTPISDSLTRHGELFRVERYRPRIEGAFARIERWTRAADGDVHWRATSRDNVASVYGSRGSSRIADPANISRIYSWLLDRTYDDKGNLIVYEYAAEDGANVPTSVGEQNRVITSERYLKRISYGQDTPYYPDATAADETPLPSDWCFQLVFDYGEHDATAPRVDDDATSARPARPDPFSRYRAGFEVRTYRLCHRALMYHRFVELGPEPVLVRSTDFVYTQGLPNGYSFLTSVTQTGYLRNATDDTYLITHPVSGETLSPRALPPLELTYSAVALDETVRVLDPQSVEHLPIGLDGTRYQWVDLDGEGAPGVLTEQAGAWFYKRNLSNLPGDDGIVPRGGAARLGPLEPVRARPSPSSIEGGRQLMDLGGDGSLCLVQFQPPMAGYFQRDPEGEWRSFAAFDSVPNVDWGDPNLKTVDLTGDGQADVLITEADVFTWYPSRGREGFGQAETVRKTGNEDDGPAVVFADGTETIHLADLSGDGLTDLVRIRNGEVCYWPSLGHGRFGAKITMANAPWFDTADQFDPKRIRLADVDGSGTTDIIYLGREHIDLYFNLSGNGWSASRRLTHLPAPDNVASVLVLDLLGNGTACLVWSSSLPGDASQRIRYVDLMGGEKPHLLIGARNNLGAETRVRYVSSTHFYMQDRAAGRPWITRLPFPVHVVERVETYDRISGNRFVARSAYHHGYFDGVEREFRGFGMVEQWDTEEIGTVPDDALSSVVTNLDAASFLPPVLTRTWFHTGAYRDGSRISLQFEDEYYHEGDPSLGAAGAAVALTDEQLRAMLLDDSVISEDLAANEIREAYRALKGSILRQEVYGLDDTEAADRPYLVSERNHTVQRLQPRHGNRHAVFFTHAREAIELHYERKLFTVGQQLLADPRVTHALTLDMDYEYGLVLRSAAVAYGRRHDDPDPILTAADRATQKRTLITFIQNGYTNPVLASDVYRAPLPCETRTYELLNVKPVVSQPGVTNLFRIGELRDAVAAASDGQHDVPYEDVEGSGATAQHPYRRLLEHARTLYRADLLTGPLPLGDLESRALPYETLALAFTAGLLADVYTRDGETLLPDPGAVLQDAGYRGGDAYEVKGLFPATDADGGWWMPSSHVLYSPHAGDPPPAEVAQARAHFFRPRRFRDPFGNSTELDYDSHDLLAAETRDALGNMVSATNDYRVLQPVRVTDANANRTDVAYDVLGLLAGTAVMGKEGESLGDSLVGFPADLDLSTLQAFTADPRSVAAGVLQGATSRTVYDVYRFVRCGQPSFAASIARQTHASDPPPPEGAKVHVAIMYCDGFGRELQAKGQAEAGDAPERAAEMVLPSGDHAPGALVLENGQPHAAPAPQRWVSTGRTVFNNKGKPIKHYEPFFSSTHLYEEEPEMTMTGVTPILGYDPVGRVTATVHADHSFEKIASDPWRQEAWDANDTVLVADPTGDEHVGAFFARLPTADYLPTWHEEHAGSPLVAEQKAAQQTTAHAATFTAAYFDTLGRPFLTIVDNGADGKYPTRVTYDIENNQRAVFDARGNALMRYDYDLRGARIRQASPDAGTRWVLSDVAANPVRAWDSRGLARRLTYDALRRPDEVWLRDGGGAERLVERLVYGEAQGGSLNHRGRVFQVFDGAGVVTSVAYDFKGNPLETSRRHAADYKSTLDWSGAVALDEPAFPTRTTYDALNRRKTLTTPDGSVVTRVFNDAGLLARITARLRGGDEVTAIVDDIEYNAKGQRELIRYGSGVRTAYEYDRRTFRLTHVETLGGTERLQDLAYCYDPIGNVTRIADAAQATVYYDNEQVEAHADYVYDALYRLTEATGREHAGSGADLPEHFPQWKPHYEFKDWTRRHKTSPADKNALRRYGERFAYDEVGNLLSVTHQSLGEPTWTRRYEYAADRNRLLGTSLPGDASLTYSAKYAYDAHGSMTAMPHLAMMEWDSANQLRMSQRQVVNVGLGERTYYVYGAGGERLRKVTERESGTRKEERIYVGAFEIYREYEGIAATVKLERETLQVADGPQKIALIETKTADANGPLGAPVSVARCQLGNHLGSAVLELDRNGEIISYEEFYAYGSTAYQAGRSLAEVSLKRYRYTAMERDEETGFYYHGARYYAPWLARWTSCDPAGLAGGLNLLEYVRGNPVRLIDPQGTDPKTPFRPPGENPGSLVAESPWLENWAAALEQQFGGGSLKKNLELFQAEIAKRPSGNANVEGTKQWYARQTYDKTLEKFIKLEADKPSYKYTPEQMAELEGGRMPDKGMNLHHLDAISGKGKTAKAAADPSRAVDPMNLAPIKGGEKSAVQKGSQHHGAHFGKKGEPIQGKPLTEFQAKQARIRNESRMTMTPGVGALSFLSFLQPAIDEVFNAATGRDVEARAQYSEVFPLSPDQREELVRKRDERRAEEKAQRDKEFLDKEVERIQKDLGLSREDAEATLELRMQVIKEEMRKTSVELNMPVAGPLYWSE